MIINILNYNNGISDEEVESCIDNFIRYLKQNAISCDNIQFKYNDEDVRKTVDKLIAKYSNGNPILENFNFQLEINDLFDEQRKVVLVGIRKEIITKNPWGDAWEIISIIKKPYEKVIWHEVAHLIGADDHYDNKHNPKTVCKSDMCIMRYGILEGMLCDESLEEIRKYLS